MNVIGNNIANVNTYGFKSSRVTFSDVFYQTISSATGPKGDATSGTGGTNSTQLGYGAKVNSVDVINTRAGSATTDRALDVYVNGDGYLPVKDSDNTIKYTRVGVLSFDDYGNLVDRNGNKVLGFNLDATTKNAVLKDDGTQDITSLQVINIPEADREKYTGIAIGSNGEITAIKEGDPTFVPATGTGWMDGTPTVTATSNYDGSVTMTVNRHVTSGAHPVTVTSNANVGTGGMELSWDNNTTPTTWTLRTDIGGTPVNYTAAYDAAATSVTFNITGGGTVTVPVGTGGYAGNTTAVSIATAVSATTYDVTASTTLKSGAAQTLTVTPSIYDATANTPSLALGDITIKLDNTDFETALAAGFTDHAIGSVGAGAGVPTKIASIATVKFGNPDGLSQDGESYYVQTPNSGDPIATIPGNGGTGTFRAGALEMSNVDLSREFTEMIITQRGFQANTRMITTSDEMLSELVSMKR
jgi:flagellar hook protein FlgE